MPLTTAGATLGAGALSGGAGLADSLLRMYGTRKQNEKNMELMLAQRGWNMQDWMRNRQWDLRAWNKQNKYNMQLWNMQNEYNSPAQQMQRFREAGLNPHLIYGKGTAGPAGPIQTGKPATAGDVKGMSIPEMKNTMQGFKGFENIYNIRQTQANTNNIEAMTQVNMQEAILKAQETANKAILGKQMGLKYKQDSALYDTNITYAQERVRQLTAEANVSVGTQQDRIDQVSKQVELLGKQITGQKRENKLKLIKQGIDQIQLELNEQGIFKTDNIIIRAIAQEKGISNFKDYIKDILKKNFNPTSQWKFPW